MALGNLDRNSHSPLAQQLQQLRSGCMPSPALCQILTMGSLFSACPWALAPPQTLDSLLEGVSCCSRMLAVSEVSLKPATCLPASDTRGQHPIPKGMACHGVTLSVSSAHHTEQPCWHEGKGVNETAEIVKMKKNWQKSISASSVFSLPGLVYLTAPLSQASVSSCLVQENWQTHILP